MAKNNKMFIFLCILPALLAYLIIFAYPILRTVLMSFFFVSNPSTKFNEWQFVGFGNFQELFNSTMFIRSLKNIVGIWFYGGIAVIFISLLMAVILTSGVRFKSFFRSAIYLPNIISAVAMANMWLHYAFNVKYGFFHSLFKALGLKSLSNFEWTSPDNIFFSLIFAFTFGAVGYYMLIFIAGIEKIPKDLFDSAFLDGSNIVKNFFYITLPLLKGVFRTCLTLWTTGSLGFYVWSQMFAPLEPQISIITPIVYLYTRVFGTQAGMSTADLNSGLGAAICIILMVIAVFAFGMINLLIKDDKLEF